MKEYRKEITIVISIIVMSSLFFLFFDDIFVRSTGVTVDLDEVEVAIMDEDEQDSLLLNAETVDDPVDRYASFQETDHLENNKGLIYIYSEEKERNINMRYSDTSLSLLFISSDCQINEIKEADKPDDDEIGIEYKHRYQNEAKYILALPDNYADKKVIDESHQVELKDELKNINC